MLLHVLADATLQMLREVEMLPVWKLETLCPDKHQCHLTPQTWTNSINQANKMALLAWAKETGIDLVQINGQRRYGGPPPGR